MGHLAPGRDIAGLHGSYHIERALSKAGLFVATRDGELALLKEVHVGDADAWTRIDELVRDARVSKHLSHPRIPAFLELFVFDGEQARAPEALSRETPAERTGETSRLPSLVLARRFVEGGSIADAMREGRRFVAADMERALRGLLEARRYLDGLLPSVVHGDISPGNVILSKDGHPSLIDFGTAAEPQEDPMLAAGPAAPSDKKPSATPWTAAADLHAIAMTVLAAASHLTPAQMPRLERDGTVDIGRVAPLLSPRVQEALRACFNADSSHPPLTAAAILKRLDERWPRPRRAAEAIAKTLRARKARKPLIMAGAALLCAGVVAWHPWRSTVDPSNEVADIALLAAVTEPAGEKASPAATTDTPAYETPSSDSGPPSVTETLQWAGVVQRGTGDLETGEPCVLALDVTPASDYASCTVRLTCGEQVLIDGLAASECRLNEIDAGDTFVYKAALWLDGADNEGLDAAMFGTTGRLYVARTGSDGKKSESYRIKLSEKSQPRHGDPLFSSRYLSAEKVIRGTAVASSGKHRIAKGQPCSYTVAPNTSGGFLQDSDTACQAKIECGGQVLYDGAGACGLDGSGVPHYEDSSPSAIDTDPRLVYDGRTLTVSDIEPNGAWKVSIYLDEDPSPHDPDTE